MAFRTRTGQTGHDAYIYEAAALANAQRELNKKLKTLLEVVHEEAPETFNYSTDWHPQLTEQPNKAKKFLEYLQDYS